MRITMLAGYPVEQHHSPNVGGTMDAHHGQVLHIAQGSYRGTIAWQMNPDQRYANGTPTTTSSTWIVGREPGEVAQMADTDVVAWCQRGGSRTWNSVELAGFAPDPPTAWQVEACAHLLLADHTAYGNPLAVADNPDGRGLGHHSMDREWLGEDWGHDACPGPGVIAAKQAIVARALVLAQQSGEALPVDPKEYERLLNTTTIYESPTGRRTFDAILTATDTRTAAILAQLAAVRAELAAAAGRDPLDEKLLAELIWASLPAQGLDKVEAVLAGGLSRAEMAELAARLQARLTPPPPAAGGGQ